MNRLALVGAAVVILAAVALAYYYLQPTGTATIQFAGQRLTVELAKTSAQQEKGLSGRPSLASDRGMLFEFAQPGRTGFWMNGMEFPLDIIWFDSNLTVVYIASNLPPCTTTDCPIYAPPSAALYALEVNAGFASQHNVTLGDSFAFVG